MSFSYNNQVELSRLGRN